MKYKIVHEASDGLYHLYAKYGWLWHHISRSCFYDDLMEDARIHNRERSREDKLIEEFDL